MILNWKAKAFVFLCIFFMTGPFQSLQYGNLIVNVIVGACYFLGVLGLYSIYESWRYRDKNKRWLVLFFGLFSVLIAYYTLEILYLEMYGVRLGN